MTRATVALVLVLGGCLPEGPDLLAQRVWTDYRMDGEPPEVTWRHPPFLDCREGWGWSEPTLNGQCVAGATWVLQWRTIVAVPPGETLDQVALAHEMNHARLWRTIGDDDPNHHDPSFGPNGLVVQENQRLAGLATP